MIQRILFAASTHARLCLILGLAGGLLLPAVAGALVPWLPHMVAGLLVTTALRIGHNAATGAMSDLRWGLGSVVVLQTNSTGSVISTDELNELADVIATAEVPIAMWVGPSGARATGPWVELAGLVDRIGVAPGSRIGDSGSTRLLDARFGDLLGPAGAG